MQIYQWLCLFSVPALIAGVCKWAGSKFKKQKMDTDALRLGMQALLRAQMIADYNRWVERGYAPIYARENFENCYTQYHALGANGVMADIRAKFMALPTHRGEEL